MKLINVTLRDSVKITDEAKSLFLTFNYDPDIVASIKTIKPRHWHGDIKAWEVSQEAIYKLIKIFGERSLNIADDVDLNYVKQEFIITETNEEWNHFNPLLAKLHSDVREFTIEALNKFHHIFIRFLLAVQEDIILHML